MTKREALQVLIEHAAQNVAGVGCGIRREISKDEQGRVVEAMQIIWPQAFGYPMGQNDLYNRGLSVLISKKP